MSRTVLKARISWQNLCQLSLGMCNMPECNPLEEEPQEGLVYMAGNSFGGREVAAGPAVHCMAPEYFGGWDGYSEEGAQSFFWSSATSDASIEARRTRAGHWVAVFRGTEIANRPESFYLVAFGRRVDLDTLQVVTVRRRARLAETLDHVIEGEFAGSEDTQKLRILAGRLGLKDRAVA